MFVHDLHVHVDQPCLSMLKLVDYLLVQVDKSCFFHYHLVQVDQPCLSMLKLVNYLFVEVNKSCFFPLSPSTSGPTMFVHAKARELSLRTGGQIMFFSIIS